MTDLIDVVLFENKEKQIQYRFTISEFRDVNYLSIREWYQDFEGHYAPSSNGVTLPYSLHLTSSLYWGLASLLSKAEVLGEVKQYKEFVAELQSQAEIHSALTKLLGPIKYFTIEKTGEDTAVIKVHNE